MRIDEAIELAISNLMNASDKWYQAKIYTDDAELKAFYLEQRDQTRQAADTLRTLTADVEAMARAIQALIDESWNYTDDMGGITCTCCSGVGMVDVEIEHDPDCPVRLARQARAKWSDDDERQ